MRQILKVLKRLDNSFLFSMGHKKTTESQHNGTQQIVKYINHSVPGFPISSFAIQNKKCLIMPEYEFVNLNLCQRSSKFLINNYNYRKEYLIGIQMCFSFHVGYVAYFGIINVTYQQVRTSFAGKITFNVCYIYTIFIFIFINI